MNTTNLSVFVCLNTFPLSSHFIGHVVLICKLHVLVSDVFLKPIIHVHTTGVAFYDAATKAFITTTLR